jgi:hypothetical protein
VHAHVLSVCPVNDAPAPRVHTLTENTNAIVAPCFHVIALACTNVAPVMSVVHCVPSTIA